MKSIRFLTRFRQPGSLAAVSFAVLLLLLVFPVAGTTARVALAMCALAAWAAAIRSVWYHKAARFALFSMPVLLMIPFCLPGRPINSAELAAGYVRRMAALEGARYVWGGEGGTGIDCSGLPRRALRDALLHDGLCHVNGRSFRLWLEQWWFDASARSLGEGYRGYTFALGGGGTIRTLDCQGLSPGDLAVTTGGRHVLAYMGNGLWIQADPGIGHVATLDGRTADNGWFDTPVTTHRWTILGSGHLSR